MRRTHCNKIVVSNRAKILVTEGHQRLGSTRCRDELHADRVRPVLVDHGAEIAASQPVLQQVSRQNDDVQRSNRHLLHPGYAVTKRGAPLQSAI
jgi:hypothetical protein